MLEKLSQLSIKNVWPILFWGWVVVVSLWIDQVSVDEPSHPMKTQHYSGFAFTNMQFEQLYETGVRIQVLAASSEYDSEARMLGLVDPQLTWENNKENSRFIATGEKGEIQVSVAESALPSEFKFLKITGNAKVEGKNSIVESDLMYFDTINRLFYCPGPFTSKQGGFTTQSQGMYYDPIKDTVSQLDNSFTPPF